MGALWLFALSSFFSILFLQHSTCLWSTASSAGSPAHQKVSVYLLETQARRLCRFLAQSCSRWRSPASSGTVMFQQRRAAVARGAVLSSAKACRESLSAGALYGQKSILYQPHQSTRVYFLAMVSEPSAPLRRRTIKGRGGKAARQLRGRRIAAPVPAGKGRADLNCLLISISCCVAVKAPPFL